MILTREKIKAGMTGGQQFDMEYEGRPAGTDIINNIVKGKTAALFSCACLLGCVAASADEPEEKLAAEFGENVGFVFQITDDLLDKITTGKTAGKDEKSGKNTFLSLYGEEKTRALAAEYAEKAIDCLQRINGRRDIKERLAAFARYILEREK